MSADVKTTIDVIVSFAAGAAKGLVDRIGRQGYEVAVGALLVSAARLAHEGRIKRYAFTAAVEKAWTDTEPTKRA